MINWKATQEALLNTPYNPGPIDGIPGCSTYTAIFALAANRQPDEAIHILGAAAPSTLNAKSPEGPTYGLDQSPERLAEFLAQTSNETGGYTVFSENLNYSAERAHQVWPNRFPTVESARPYAHNPRALANKVYGSRGGNEVNGINDNDGWENRGGGLTQHTFKAEYDALRKRLDITSEEVHAGGARALLAACDYWYRANVNKYVDKGEFKAARGVTNSGNSKDPNPLGWKNVEVIRNRLLKVIK